MARNLHFWHSLNLGFSLNFTKIHALHNYHKMLSYTHFRTSYHQKQMNTSTTGLINLSSEGGSEVLQDLAKHNSNEGHDSKKGQLRKVF